MKKKGNFMLREIWDAFHFETAKEDALRIVEKAEGFIEVEFKYNRRKDSFPFMFKLFNKKPSSMMERSFLHHGERIAKNGEEFWHRKNGKWEFIGFISRARKTSKSELSGFLALSIKGEKILHKKTRTMEDAINFIML